GRIARLRLLPLLLARGELLRRHVELDEALLRVDGYRVAVLHQRDGAADVGFRRDVPDHHAPSAAGEAPVGQQAHRFAQPLADERRGRREHLLHPRPALRPLVADHDHVARFDSLRHDRLHAIVLGIEDARRTGDDWVLEPGDLGYAAFRREVALEDREMALAVHRLRPGPDYLLAGARLGNHV